MKVRFKKLFADAKAPERAHDTDAGADLFAYSGVVDEYGNFSIGTGLAVEIPAGYVGLLFARSSLSRYRLSVANSVGVIDAGYIGEISIKFKPTPILDLNKKGSWPKVITPEGLKGYRRGDKCAQLVIVPIPSVEFDEVQELEGGERGEGGYGSTGM